METTVGQSDSMKAIKPINNVFFLIKEIQCLKTCENVFKKESQGACCTLLLTVTPLLVLSGIKTQCNSLCCDWPYYIISVLQLYLSGGKTKQGTKGKAFLLLTGGCKPKANQKARARLRVR